MGARKRDMVTAAVPAPTTPTHITLPLAFANALVQYLGTKPGQEVIGFLNGFGQLAREQGITPPPPPQDTPSNG